MRDSLELTLDQLGLAHRGILTTRQKSLMAAKGVAHGPQPEIATGSLIPVCEVQIEAALSGSGEGLCSDTKAGSILSLRLERGTEYTVAATDFKDRVVGRLKGDGSETAANLLSAGKEVFAKVDSTSRSGGSVVIHATLCMRDR